MSTARERIRRLADTVTGLPGDDDSLSNDLREVLAELEAAEGKRDEVRVERYKARSHAARAEEIAHQVERERDEARAEVARLRNVIAKWSCNDDKCEYRVPKKTP